MRIFLMIILAGLIADNASGQLSFTPVDSKLRTHKDKNLTELTFSSSEMVVKFPLKRNVTVMQQNNFVTIDSQTIQIIALQFRDYKKVAPRHSSSKEKQLLEIYSQYELKYFKNELGIEVINPNYQWVMTKSRGWFIWYFKVGSTVAQVDKQTMIQIFASTVIGDRIFTINAPILSDGDFKRAGQVVNEMMEKIIITRK